MVDENDPLVRAVAAPFEANMGDFRRRINDANAQFSDEMRALEEKVKAREEKLAEQQAAGTAPEVQELLRKAKAEREQAKRAQWDYDNPIPDEQRRIAWPQPAAQPETQPEPPTAPVPAAPAWDYGDPLSSNTPTPRRGWPGQVSEPPTEGIPVAQPPPPPRRPARKADPADDDYSGQSWLQ